MQSINWKVAIRKYKIIQTVKHTMFSFFDGLSVLRRMIQMAVFCHGW